MDLRHRFLITTSLAASALLAHAGAPSLADKVAPSPKESSLYERIWSIPQIYKDESNDLLQEFSFVGRYMGQYGIIDGNGEEWQGWENREMRAGAKMRFLHQFELEGQVNLNTDAPHLYDRLTTVTLTWKPSDAFNLTVGKQVTKFSYEGSISTTQILTFERSLITAAIWPSPEYATGVTASGKIGNFLYNTGVFAGDQQAEFSDFSGGAAYLVSIGYDLAKDLGIEKGVIRADWFHNDGDPGNTALKHFADSFSLNSQWQNGALGLNTDIIAAKGLGNQSDFWGFLIEPFYNITEKLQVVTRYTFAGSSDANGLSLMRRYEQKIASGKGDEYQAGYLGLNYYLYGHKLKLMTGVEYSHMSDRARDGGSFSGWTWLNGIRMYF